MQARNKNVEKVLVVGEPQTGKTSLISEFIDYDGPLADKAGPRPPPRSAAQKDFHMKIIKVEGQKVRMQIWDQVCKDPQSTFNPLFSRHASGCVVVANSLNVKTIKQAQMWREEFDKATKVQGERSFPCVLFLNHHEHIPHDDQTRMENLVAQAGEPGTFDAIHHVCLSDKDSIYLAFENIAQIIINEGKEVPRTDTETFIAGGGIETQKFDAQLKNKLVANARGGKAGEDARKQSPQGQFEEPYAGRTGDGHSFKISRKEHGSIAGQADLERKRKCRC